MSGAFSQASASSYINQCQFIEEQTQGALIKAVRAITGQYKAIGPLSVPSSTTFVVEPEFSFPVKAGQRYVLMGEFLISSAAAGGAKLQLNAPANTTGTSVLSGKSLAAGTATVNATLGLTTGAATSTLNATSLYSNAQVTDAVFVEAFIIPAFDDMITFSFAQNTSNATASVLLQGSWVNLMQLSGSRRAPNVV
jgi:hypothetical protein